MRNYAGTALMILVTLAAAIGSYTINLRVSAERAAVDRLRNQLVADAREIRTLQVELRTRARFPEMQRWNDGVFQMSAPAAGQYLRSPVQLASYAAAPGVAPPAPRPDVVFAVTAPETITVPTTGVVTAAYIPATAPEAARLIRAGYTARPAAVAEPAPLKVILESAPPKPAPARTAQPAKATQKHPAQPPAPAPSAPIDLLPTGGQ